MIPCALTIAGSDSGGGAGIQADLKTFAALEVFGTSALTAVTAQNTRGVRAWEALSPALVRAQVEAVLEDFPIACAKTGMLADAGLIEVVADVAQARGLPLVIDPVMVAKGGASLLEKSAEQALRERLCPIARLVTPNLPEAEVLLGRPVVTPHDQADAARALCARGARAALVKGGHSSGDPVDVLFDGTDLHTFAAPRLDTRHTHGTGCTFSAAITALLARGLPLREAVARAHAYVHEAIRQAPGLGTGHGPLHHLHPWYAAGGGGAA